MTEKSKGLNDMWNEKVEIERFIKGRYYKFIVYISSSGLWRSLIEDKDGKWRTFNDQYDTKEGAIKDLESLVSLVGPYKHKVLKEDYEGEFEEWLSCLEYHRELVGKMPSTELPENTLDVIDAIMTSLENSIKE